jgi:RimJ/RimL family protein N-acetyltransferase
MEEDFEAELIKFLPELDLTDYKPHKNSMYPLVPKRLRPEHALALQKALKEGTEHIAGYFSWAENAHSWSTKQALFWIQAQLREVLPSEHFVLFLGKEIVGMGSLKPYGHPRNVQMAYWTSKKYLRQGIGETIARTMEGLAFVHRPYQYLYINHDSSNRASGSIPQKLGYGYIDYFDEAITAKSETGLWFSWRKESKRYKDYPTEREQDLRFAELHCLMMKEMYPEYYEREYKKLHMEAVEKLKEIRGRTVENDDAA